MATARVAGSHNVFESGNSASAVTLGYAGALTIGSTLEVTVTTYNAAITLTVLDNVNGAYTQMGTYSIGSDTNTRVSKWIFKNNASNAFPVVSVTPSASAYVSLSLDEYTGLGANPTVHATAAASHSTEDPVVTGTVTASAGDLVVAALANDAFSASSVSAPFSLSAAFGPVAGEGLSAAYHLSAAGDEACTFDMPAGDIGASFIVSITPDAGGGGGPTQAQIAPAITRQLNDSIIGRVDAATRRPDASCASDSGSGFGWRAAILRGRQFRVRRRDAASDSDAAGWANVRGARRAVADRGAAVGRGAALHRGGGAHPR